MPGLYSLKPDFTEWRTAGLVKEHSGCRPRGLGLSLGSFNSCVVLGESLNLSGPTFLHRDKHVSPGAASLRLLGSFRDSVSESVFCAGQGIAYSEHVFPGISFGAACPLDSVEKTLQDAVAELPAHKTEVFRGVLEQLRWLGGKQVKSVAVSPRPGASRPRGQGLSSHQEPHT